MRATLVFALVLSVLMVIFALLNNEDMVVNFGFFDTRGPKALVLIITFALGALAGALAMFSSQRRKRREQKTRVGAASPAAPPAPGRTEEEPAGRPAAEERRPSSDRPGGAGTARPS